MSLDPASLPLDAVAMRFGYAVTDYFGRLSGRLADPRRWYRIPERYRRRFEFDGQIESTETLLFPLRRRHHLYDHAVFVTYSLSFMMMLVVVAGLLVWGNAPVLASLLFFVPPIHMYRQLKGAYQLGRLSALVRTAALVTFAFVAITFFTIAIVGLGAFS